MCTNNYEGITDVIQITSNRIERCHGVDCELPRDFASALNHHINEHGYKILHLGTQSFLHDSGNIGYEVIALLGK